MILALSQLAAKVSTTAPAASPAAVATPAAQSQALITTTVTASSNSFFSQLIFYLFNLIFFAYLIFLWFFLVRWVGRDAAWRGVNSRERLYYQVIVLIFNLPGLLLYLLLRPTQTLAEKKRAEMEDEVLKLELDKLRKEDK